MSYAIETHQLHKQFSGGVNALNGLDMSVAAGSVYGLIGRNGAGKATAMRLLAGILNPSQGHYHILGVNMRKAGPAEHANYAYVSPAQQLPRWSSVARLGSMLSSFYPNWDEACLKTLCTHFSIDPLRPVHLCS
ncbi:MAG: ABC-2 type transport system ATP-binding protein [Kiritimatiellia bacterium]|jgi:ABC-2 type transport system ATP-binding protein